MLMLKMYLPLASLLTSTVSVWLKAGMICCNINLPSIEKMLIVAGLLTMPVLTVMFTEVLAGMGKVDEGEADLVTIGPCCNTDYQQGPEKFIEPSPDNIQNKKLVVWYVAQLKNDDAKGKEYCWAESVLENGVYVTKAYPCFAGPMFIPINLKK